MLHADTARHAPRASRVVIGAYRRDDYDVKDQFGQLAALALEDPDREAIKDAVVVRCLQLADNIARRFDGRGEPHDDLVQVARLGLVKAVARFDVTRGFDFVSFAVPTIMGEVRRHFRDTGWTIHVPRRLQETNLALSRSIGDLSQQLGRSPTAKELAAELGLGIGEVTRGLLASHAYRPVSFDAPVCAGSGEPPLAETLGGIDARFGSIDDHEVLRPLLAQLPERERTVLVLRFFGNLTQTQIAAKVGISQMHVSRLLARTLAQLREDLS